jgi:hypothetical protein
MELLLPRDLLVVSVLRGAVAHRRVAEFGSPVEDHDHPASYPNIGAVSVVLALPLLRGHEDVSRAIADVATAT